MENNITMYETADNIEKILNMKKIRYECMNEIFKNYKGILAKESTINLFIDLPSTIKQLYNPKNINGISGLLSNKTKYCIAGTLLNMIGHYRHYFISRYQVFTNVIFMYNSKVDTYIKDELDPDYKKTLYEKRILLENPIYSDLNCLMRDNYKIMKQIIQCIPHAYFFDSEYMDYRCIFPYLIDKEDFKDNFNIILTTNELMFQNTLIGETVILQPKLDKSNIITSNYIIKALSGKSKTITSHPEYLLLNPENIHLIEALINHSDYDTKGIRNFSYGKAITFLNKNQIDINKIILNGSIIKDLFKNILTSDEIEKTIINLKIYNNFMLSNKYNKSLDLLYPNYIKELSDNEGIVKVNHAYFKHTPLKLDYIFEGECLDE